MVNPLAVSAMGPPGASAQTKTSAPLAKAARSRVLDVVSLLEEHGGLLELMRCLFALRYGLLSSVPTSCSTRSSTALGAVPMMSAWRLRQSRLRS